MGLTRRTLLARATAALLALSGLSRFAPAAPSRSQTYVALVEAVGRGTRSQVDPARTEFAAGWLRDQQGGPGRAAEDVLDRLAMDGFTRLDVDARIAYLREVDDRELAARAVALAAAPFHPPAGDFHPTPVVL